MQASRCELVGALCTSVHLVAAGLAPRGVVTLNLQGLLMLVHGDCVHAGKGSCPWFAAGFWGA